MKLASQAGSKDEVEKFSRNALDSCNKALTIDAKSWKALLRKGEAYVYMNSPDEAKSCLLGALSLCGEDATAKTNISKEMVKVEKLFKKIEVKERKMAAAMFGGGNYSDGRSSQKESSSSSSSSSVFDLNGPTPGASSSGAR